MPITLEPTRIDTGSDDDEGILVKRDGMLVAVIVRLSERGDDAPRWFLEAGFGGYQGMRDVTFASLADAGAWFARTHVAAGRAGLRRRLTMRPASRCARPSGRAMRGP